MHFYARTRSVPRRPGPWLENPQWRRLRQRSDPGSRCGDYRQRRRGGTTAEILSAAGYKVLLIEEGPLKTSSDFKLLEDEAYASLYQEGIGRMSKDGAITILQGRAVGGTTLINWTSSFRTPDATLAHWASEYAVTGHSSAEMAPWFEKMEQRLGIAPWAIPECQQRCDSQRLRKTRLQLARDSTQRARLLQPGVLRHGLPGQRQAVDAGHHHSVHPGKGGELLYLARAEQLKYSGDTISSLECVAMDERCVAPPGARSRSRPSITSCPVVASTARRC